MAAPIPLGLMNQPSNTWGTGPGGDTGVLNFGATAIIPSEGSISTLIDEADAANILLFVNFVDSRSHWTHDDTSTPVNWVYEPASYENQIKRWSVAGNSIGESISQALYDKIVDAINRRRIICYVVDEPFHFRFRELSNVQIDQMAAWHKEVFGNNAITVIRVTGSTMETNAPPGGWQWYDYTWSQYEGNLHAPAIGLTPQQYYQQEWDACVRINMGMIPGFNLQDGGSNTCWNNTFSTPAASGRTSGTFVSTGTNIVKGTHYACSFGEGTPVKNTRWTSNPTEVRAAVDGMMAIAAVKNQAPAFMMWTYPQSAAMGASVYPFFLGLFGRQDYIDAMDYQITTLNARATWAGWRTPKGTAPPPVGITANATSEQAGGSSPQGYIHTPVGTTKAVVVTISQSASLADLITSVTYGGVAMTRVRREFGTTPDGSSYLYFLGSGVPQGAQQVLVNKSVAQICHITVTTVTASGNMIVVAAGGSSIDQGSVLSVPLNYAGKTGMAFSVLWSGRDAVTSIVDGAGLTRMHDHDFGTEVSVVARQTTEGSANFTVAFTPSGSDAAAICAMVIAVDAGVPTVVIPGVAVPVVTGLAPVVKTPRVARPGCGQVIATGFVPSLGTRVLPGTGQLVITGFNTTSITPIFFDSSTENVAAADPQTFTHTPNQATKGVVVTIVHAGSSADLISGVTYGGVALTRVRRQASTSPAGASYIYFRGEGLPAGPQTVSVDRTEGTLPMQVTCQTFTSNGNISIVDSDGISVAQSAQPSVNLQYNGLVGMAVGVLFSGADAVSDVTELTGLTRLQDHDFGTEVAVVSRQTVEGNTDLTFGFTVAQGPP